MQWLFRVLNRYGDARLLLPVEADDDLNASPIGKVAAVLTQAEETATFTLYDTHDQSLRRARQVLIEFDDRLELCPDGMILSQQAKNCEKFVAEMTVGSVKQALSYVLTLRRLMAICTGQMRRLDLALMDDKEKTQGQCGACQPVPAQGHVGD